MKRQLSICIEFDTDDMSGLIDAVEQVLHATINYPEDLLSIPLDGTMSFEPNNATTALLQVNRHE